MEYIAPGENGLNSLENVLRHDLPDLIQTLRWGIQFCYGMEHAFSRGLRSHRDIKPGNIMISENKTVKISDFGIAKAFGTSRGKGIVLNIQHERVGLSGQTLDGVGFGTPTHMPPEQFTDAAKCDEKSDIYSFGIVLYQMTASGKLPFLTSLPKDNSIDEANRFWRAMYNLHRIHSVPNLDSPLWPLIQRCLEKDPRQRYSGFGELREDLEKILYRQTGDVIKLPTTKTGSCWEWSNKGNSLTRLGHFEEAIGCFEKAIEFDSQDAFVWTNMGVAYSRKGNFNEALRCFNQALNLNPREAGAWNNKGLCLNDLNCLDEAIGCFDRALQLASHHPGFWCNKGESLRNLNQLDDSIQCFDQALALDPRNAMAWSGKGISLTYSARFNEAIECFNQALMFSERLHEPKVWYIKAFAEEGAGRFPDAANSWKEFLEIASNESELTDEAQEARQRLQDLARRMQGG
ncbi:MAG: serine/threonine-protein kinase, partial [Nitrospirota bacterium]